MNTDIPSGPMRLWRKHPALVTGAVAIVATAILVWFLPATLPVMNFRKFDLEAFNRSLVPLLVIAVLIERTVEVLFGITREPDDRRVQGHKEQAEEALRALDPALTSRARGVALAAAASREPQPQLLPAPSEAASDPRTALYYAQYSLAASEDELAQRRADATRIAFTASLTLSVVAAILGARLLALLVTNPQSPVPTPWLTAYNILDVLLSAGLLAGGAEGFHHLTSVVRVFLESLQKRADEQGRTPPPNPAPAPAPVPGPAPAPAPAPQAARLGSLAATALFASSTAAALRTITVSITNVVDRAIDIDGHPIPFAPGASSVQAQVTAGVHSLDWFVQSEPGTEFTITLSGATVPISFSGTVSDAQQETGRFQFTVA